MNDFGGDLWDALEEAAALFEGEREAAEKAIEQIRNDAVALRRRLNLTQAQMAPMMGMSLSGYRKWEQGQRAVSGPAAVLLKVIENDPEAVKQALAS
jgi:putative transcriptional regulator